LLRQCIDTQTDVKHCGSCQNVCNQLDACKTIAGCSAGRCVAGSQPDGTQCTPQATAVCKGGTCISWGVKCDCVGASCTAVTNPVVQPQLDYDGLACSCIGSSLVLAAASGTTTTFSCGSCEKNPVLPSEWLCF
jgi:hypothetical protein